MLLNLLRNFGHLIIYQWVETARYKYEHVYSCNICLGKARKYGNALYGRYEKVFLWADWGLEIREFIQEQVIVYGKVLFRNYIHTTQSTSFHQLDQLHCFQCDCDRLLYGIM